MTETIPPHTKDIERAPLPRNESGEVIHQEGQSALQAHGQSGRGNVFSGLWTGRRFVEKGEE